MGVEEIGDLAWIPETITDTDLEEMRRLLEIDGFKELLDQAFDNLMLDIQTQYNQGGSTFSYKEAVQAMEAFVIDSNDIQLEAMWKAVNGEVGEGDWEAHSWTVDTDNQDAAIADDLKQMKEWNNQKSAYLLEWESRNIDSVEDLKKAELLEDLGPNGVFKQMNIVLSEMGTAEIEEFTDVYHAPRTQSIVS